MSNITTIGDLVDALNGTDPSLLVFIDNRPPTALSSYRGYYEQLAIERLSDVANETTEIDTPSDPFEINLPGWGTYTPGSSEVRIRTSPTVSDLIEALNLAVGATFEGYKGGQFTMDRSSDLWVSEYGNCDGLRIDRMEILPGRLDLFTIEERGW